MPNCICATNFKLNFIPILMLSIATFKQYANLFHNIKLSFHAILFQWAP